MNIKKPQVVWNSGLSDKILGGEELWDAIF